jgi:hypothetical protein
LLPVFGVDQESRTEQAQVAIADQYAGSPSTIASHPGDHLYPQQQRVQEINRFAFLLYFPVSKEPSAICRYVDYSTLSISFQG